MILAGNGISELALTMFLGIRDLGYILLNLSIVVVLVFQVQDQKSSPNNQLNRPFAT